MRLILPTVLTVESFLSLSWSSQKTPKCLRPCVLAFVSTTRDVVVVSWSRKAGFIMLDVNQIT